MGLFSFITEDPGVYQVTKPTTSGKKGRREFTSGGCPSMEVQGIRAAEKAAKKSTENSEKLDSIIQHSLDLKQELSSQRVAIDNQRIAIDNILQRLDNIEDGLRKDQTLKNNFPIRR